MGALLNVDDLHVQFRRGYETVYAVNGVSFTVEPGETLGVLGESGSGKSVSVMSMLGLLRGDGKVTQGSAIFEEKVDLLKLSRRQLEDIRGRDIGVVFQDPMTSLNPTMRIGDQIMEGMIAHNYSTRRASYERTLELLSEVGIPEPRARSRNYPFELSGGMRQRVMIAMAIACKPQLLIADEPTTAVDVTVQMQILSLLQGLRDSQQMSVIMITHDFGVATNFCSRIMVMYAGQIMEVASLQDFLTRPAHPYTIGMRASLIEVGHRGRKLVPIPGSVPTLVEPPHACSFASRCSFVQERCRRELPMLRDFGGGHAAACHFAEEVMEHVRTATSAG